MGKHKKHEEHENHERWLVCYADMVTLLFALFVVLYSMGVTELEKISQVAKSIQFAFHIEGTGKTQTEGIFDSGSGEGQILNANPMQTGQEGRMEEYLDEALQDDFQKTTGQSLDIDVLDDTFRITSPVSAWFTGQDTQSPRQGCFQLLERMLRGAVDRVSEVKVRIEAPYHLIGRRGNKRITSIDLSHERLNTLFHMVQEVPRVKEGGIQTEFRQMEERYQGSWQDKARVVVEFGNGKDRGGNKAPPPDRR